MEKLPEDKLADILGGRAHHNKEESDSDTNNAVVPSDNDSIGCFSGGQAEPSPANIIFDKNLYAEIMDMGFEEEKVKLAMKMSSDKTQIIDLIMKMDDDKEFYSQIKANASMEASNKLIKVETGYKMVIVVREDLGMSTGKIAAQVGHAVLGCYKLSCDKNSVLVAIWEKIGQAKIVLGCKNLEELKTLKTKADEAGIVNYLVMDAGRTQIPEGSITCCAFGPDNVDKIDALTGKLKLL